MVYAITYTGTIPILRQHIFELFLTHPPCISIDSTERQEKCHFLTRLHAPSPFADVIKGWSHRICLLLRMNVAPSGNFCNNLHAMKRLSYLFTGLHKYLLTYLLKQPQLTLQNYHKPDKPWSIHKYIDIILSLFEISINRYLECRFLGFVSERFAEFTQMKKLTMQVKFCWFCPRLRFF